MNYFWNTVSSDGSSFDLLLLLAASAMKATLLLGFVALLCLFVRRFSAATRHLLWTLSLCAALLLPFLSALEVWEVPVLPAQISSWSPAQPNELTSVSDAAFQFPEASAQQQQGRAVPPKIKGSKPIVSDFQPAIQSVEEPLPATNTSEVYAPPQHRNATFWPALVNWALAIWLVGALLLVFRLLVGLLSTKLLTRGAVEFKNAKMVSLFSSLLAELQLKGKVRLLRSERTLMPIVCGVLRPTVMLPASADDWSEERSRMVLLHELTHVTRKDCLTQMLAQTACAFYWFNPFVWHAARRLRVEREQACDDYVLSIGTKPSDYAHHLLEIARYLQEHPVFQWSQATTVAMARKSQLEGRLLAILSKEGKRRAMSQVMTASLTALILVLFLLLAIVRPTISGAQPSQSSEAVLNEETGRAGKSSSSLFSTAIAESDDDSLVEGAAAQEENGAQGNSVDDDSQEKILSSAQPEDEAEQQSDIDPVDDIELEIQEPEPPLLESFPSPQAMTEASLPAIPFIKAKHQQEAKPGEQAKSGDYIDEMASVGYTNLSVKELVNLKSSGVTAHYVRSLSALGLGHLPVKEVAALSVNNVTPTYIETIRNAGYRDLTAKELVGFRIHGITPDLIGKLRNAGYGNLTAKQLIEFGIHQVTTEFINGMRAAGLGNLSPKDLVSLRVHAVTPAYVRDARKRLGDLTVKQIIALKMGGLMEGSDDE